MPYLVTDIVKDEFGVAHPTGVRERVDLITNPLAIINRAIPEVMNEGSATFILDRARKHAHTLPTMEEQKEFLFDVMSILNPKQGAEMEELYQSLTPREKREYIRDMISIDADGRLMTNNGMYMRREAFTNDTILRDSIIKIYEKYGDIIKPYHIFVPKPKWGRDIYVGEDCIGFQYIMMLKQSGEKGFIVRSTGSISDESLPEKSNRGKTGRSWHSEKPIRFGEYETPFVTRSGANSFNCRDHSLYECYQVYMVTYTWIIAMYDVW